jgi:hypothetical protein
VPRPTARSARIQALVSSSSVAEPELPRLAARATVVVDEQLGLV